jgi:hypothetical protein
VKQKEGESKTMQFSKLNREGSENVFRTVLNAEGATITTGLPVSLVNTSTDGIKAVIDDAAGNHPGFLGVAIRDIPNNDYGLVQTSGFVNSILLSNVGTSITINANDPLVPAPAGFASAAPTYANFGFKWLQASNLPASLVVSAASYASGLIKGW